MRELTYGSLFAGIGGFDLGFDRAGMRCVFQVEIDPFCRRVLAKHWPNVPKWDDVRTFTGEGFERPDVICGGFPCQDISLAGRGAGIEAERSGLWREYVRIVRAFRPRYVVMENVAALLIRGMGRVLGELAACGYDAEWSVLSACAMGAPHARERVFVVSHPAEVRPVFNAAIAGTDAGRKEARRLSQSERGNLSSAWSGLAPEPVRMADGVPTGMDRLGAIGNAVVPQVAEWLGRRIVAALEARADA